MNTAIIFMNTNNHECLGSDLVSQEDISGETHTRRNDDSAVNEDKSGSTHDNSATIDWDSQGGSKSETVRRLLTKLCMRRSTLRH